MKKSTALGAAATLALGALLAIPVLLDSSNTPTAQAAQSCGAGASIGTVNVSALPVQKIGVYTDKQLRNAAVIINEANKAGDGRNGAVLWLMPTMTPSASSSSGPRLTGEPLRRS